jgi:hypothetical protein
MLYVSRRWRLCGRTCRVRSDVTVMDDLISLMLPNRDQPVVTYLTVDNSFLDLLGSRMVLYCTHGG